MEVSFLQVTACQVHPVEEKHEREEMGNPNTLCFHSYDSSRRIQVIKYQTTHSLGDLATEDFSLGQSRGATARESPPGLLGQFIFPKEALNQWHPVLKELALFSPTCKFSSLSHHPRGTLSSDAGYPLSPRDASAMVYD